MPGGGHSGYLMPNAGDLSRRRGAVTAAGQAKPILGFLGRADAKDAGAPSTLAPQLAILAEGAQTTAAISGSSEPTVTTSTAARTKAKLTTPRSKRKKPLSVGHRSGAYSTFRANSAGQEGIRSLRRAATRGGGGHGRSRHRLPNPVAVSAVELSATAVPPVTPGTTGVGGAWPE